MIDVEESVIASNEMAELVSKLQEERSGAVISFILFLERNFY